MHSADDAFACSKKLKLADAPVHVKLTVVGGLKGGEAYFTGLLKEINSLQMAPSIYSNDTHSLAISVEQTPGGGGDVGAATASGHGRTTLQRCNLRPKCNCMSV